MHISRTDLQRLYNYQLMKIKGVLPKRRREPKKKAKTIEQPFQLPNELYRQNPVTKKYHPVKVPFGNYLK